MNEEVLSPAYVNRIWKFFSSVRLTVGLLLSLAFTSIIGTLIPQNESPSEYLQAYGEFLYHLFNFLGIFDMYHSWWFQFLLLTLAVNVLVCSIDRFPKIRKIVWGKTPFFDISRFKNLPNKIEFTVDRTPERLEEAYDSILSKRFRCRRIETKQEGFFIFAEKGRWTRLGVFAVHLSIILLLCGGLIGSIFGFEGFVNIPEGESISHIRLKKSGNLRPLGFEIRCDGFNVSFYDSHGRMPKEYRSSLTILEHGKPVFQKDIIVNDPLRYKGINIYQSSYGEMPPEEVLSAKNPPEQIIVSILSKESGMRYQKEAKMGEPIDMPEQMGKLLIIEYNASATFRGQPIGEAFIGILTATGAEPIQVLLPLKFANFDKMRGGNQVISLMVPKDEKSVMKAARYYTGLQVTKDPGVWIVYIGFLVMIIGCLVTFFMSHQRCCIEVVNTGQKISVTVSWTSNKNKVGMQARIGRLAKKLAGDQKLK